MTSSFRFVASEPSGASDRQMNAYWDAAQRQPAKDLGFLHTYGGSAKGRYRKSTVEVGSFRSNAFGLYDMHGNVWEWVEDCWHTDYTAGPSDASSWTDRCKERSRVLRGGSWIDPPRIIRSAYRSRNIPTYRSGTVGFRVARTLN
jgi:formylglycine-generating enzyme required for sulfatase activity